MYSANAENENFEFSIWEKDSHLSVNGWNISNVYNTFI